MAKRKVTTKADEVVAEVQIAKGNLSQDTFSLERIEAEAAELFGKMDGLKSAFVKAKVRMADHYIKLGDFLARAEKAWLDAGKPCKKPELWKACQTNSSEASRLRKLAEWYHENEAVLSELDDEERAEKVAAYLASLRSMGSATTAARKEKAESASEADDAHDDGDAWADVEAMVEETILALLNKLGLEDDEKAHRVIETEISELAQAIYNRR